MQSLLLYKCCYLVNISVHIIITLPFIIVFVFYFNLKAILFAHLLLI